MSAGYEYDYEILQQRRREIYLERIVSKTRDFLNRYQSILDDISNQGLDQYVSLNYEDFRRQLNIALNCVNSDPEKARDISQSIGKLIGALPKRAKERRRVYNEQEKQKKIERERKEKALKQEFHSLIQQELGKLKDPILRDFAKDELMSIAESFSGTIITSENFEKTKSNFLNNSKNVLNNAQKKADEFNEKYFKQIDMQIECESLLDQIQEEKENINKIKTEDTAKLEEIMKRLVSKEMDIKNGIIEHNIGRELNNISDEIITEEVNEEYRRHTVQSIFEILNKLGFKYAKPKKVGEEVRLYAKRINGNEFEASIKANGTMISHFNGYDYMACKDDIDNLEHQLQSCYGIELNKTKTLWQNPDRINKNAKPLIALERGK